METPVTTSREFADLQDQRPVKMEVPVPVTGEARAQLEAEISNVSAEIRELEQEKKEFVDGINEALKPLKEHQGDLVDRWRFGDKSFEDVVLGFDWEQGLKWILRSDGVVLGPEAITEDDKQGIIPNVAEIKQFAPREAPPLEGEGETDDGGSEIPEEASEFEEGDDDENGDEAVLEVCPGCEKFECSCDESAIFDCGGCGLPVRRTDLEIRVEDGERVFLCFACR